MDNQPNKPHVFYALLAFVAFAPSLAFAIPADGLNDFSSTASKLAPFLADTAAKNLFTEAALRFLSVGMLSLFFATAIFAFYVRSLRPASFPGLLAIIERNDPLVSVFGTPLLRHKIGVPTFTLVLAVGCFSAQFLIGGDLNACKGCTTSSSVGFLLINSLLLLASFFFLAIFLIWARLLTARG